MSPLVAIIALLIAILLVGATVASGLGALRRARRRRRDQHVYTEREVADSQRPLASGVVIVAPARAPQNGRVDE